MKRSGGSKLNTRRLIVSQTLIPFAPEEVFVRFRTTATLDGADYDALIVPVFRDGSAPAALSAPQSELAQWVARQHGEQKLFSVLSHLQRGDGDAGRTTRLIVVAAGSSEEFDLERARNVVAAGVRALWQSTTTRLAIAVPDVRIDGASALEAAVEGVHFALWRPDSHKSSDKGDGLPPLEEIVLITDDEDSAAAIDRAQAVGEAVNWTRTVANEPANLMTPTLLAKAAQELAESAGVVCEVLDAEACREIGMNTFLAVAAGSDEPAKLVVLRYHGRGGKGYDLGVVGKGITFDSGGISIKPADEMHLMRYDMSGAAAVVAATATIARLGLKVNVICVAPCTENLPGGHATKPGDVVTSLSGKTVEIINTDAEGRLVLIDGVTYAEREGAQRIVDVATLTGAIRIALGQHYTGLFGRPRGFVDAVRKAGDAAGERLWPMPLSDEYRDNMKGEVADLRNSAGRMGSAINGAAFIEAGVEPSTEWAHLDIASSGWSDEDRPYSPKGAQGVAVRTLVELARRLAD
jgi:leucyl aminopeptidase